MSTANQEPFTFRSGLEGSGVKPAHGGLATQIDVAPTLLGLLGLQKTATTLAYDAASDHYVERAADPALRDAAIAHYQTAYELFASHRYDLGEGVKPL